MAKIELLIEEARMLRNRIGKLTTLPDCGGYAREKVVRVYAKARQRVTRRIAQWYSQSTNTVAQFIPGEEEILGKVVNRNDPDEQKYWAVVTAQTREAHKKEFPANDRPKHYHLPRVRMDRQKATLRRQR